MTLVLVVDDDQDLAEMLGIVLTGAGIDVDLVSRGDEALEVFRNNPPDLVLLDVMLPGLDGIEVCRQIRPKSNRQFERALRCRFFRKGKARSRQRARYSYLYNIAGGNS